MKRYSLLFALLSCFAISASAQPVIAADGVLSAASYLPTAFPGGGIAQGSLFLVFGTNLGPAAIVQASKYPLPTTLGLGGTTIQISAGGTTTPAIMVYALAGQVAAILPSSVPVGNATLTLTFNGQTSAAVPIKVVKSSFATFTLNQGGTGPGILTDASSPTKNPDGSDQVNTLFTSAIPGDVMVLWGTGLGPVSDVANEAVKPLPGDLGFNPAVYVGGKSATIAYAGRSGCCSGLDQIVFTVPAGVSGCYVPVVVVVGGVTSTFPTMSVSTDRHTCSDPVGLPDALLSKYQSGQDVRVGSILLNRINPTLSAGGLSFGLKQDSAAASFYKFNSSSASGSLISQRSFSSLPSTGGCLVYFCRNALCTPANDPVSSSAYLDAGTSLAITNGSTSSNANQLLKETAKGQYSAALGGGIPLLPGFTPYYLEPGRTVTVSGMGGADVGGFGVGTTIPAELVWTNAASLTTVDRTKDLTVNWSGTSGNLVTINGSSTGAATPQVTATFECTALASAGTFTVPSYILQSMPASGTITQGGFTVPAGFILLSNFSAATPFTTTGLDVGALTTLDAGGKQATFQ